MQFLNVNSFFSNIVPYSNVSFSFFPGLSLRASVVCVHHPGAPGSFFFYVFRLEAGFGMEGSRHEKI